MRDAQEAASAFLADRRVAVTGVSRTPKAHGSNNVYRRLRDWGYRVYVVNPNAETVEGDHCCRDLRSIPGAVDAVVIGARPAINRTDDAGLRRAGHQHVWMHWGPDGDSDSRTATECGRQQGITVIDGGCPLMFAPTSDLGHDVMRLVYSGHVHKEV